MKIIVIGAVAAGTSAATKARRNNEKAEIMIYEKETYISYSSCGMPYYLGGEVSEIDDLIPRDPVFFQKKYNISVKTGFLVEEIHKEKKEISVRNLTTQEIFTDSYDKLIIATGATAFLPKISGNEGKNVFSLRNISDIKGIKEFIRKNHPQKAVVVGSGFVGFETMENLIQLGISVDLVESNSQLTPHLDEDMALFLEKQVKKQGVSVHKGVTLEEISETQVKLSSGELIQTDMVIFSTGVRPNTKMASESGILLGESGAIVVNDKMETNIPDISACGDCIETFSAITGNPVYRPLGTTANKTGRIAGDVVTGGNLTYRGNLSTGIFKFMEITVATTGLTEKEAEKHGFETQVCHNIKPHRAIYMGGEEMVIKAIADKKTSRLLGVQIIGGSGVDKRIDVFATLITYKATVDELFHLDLAYAPPFSTTKDPIHYTGMILDNAIRGNRELMTSEELEQYVQSNEEIQLVDTRSPSDFEKKGTVLNAMNIPQDKLREEILPLNPDVLTVTFCNKGVTGNAAQNILQGRGFQNVKNLSGGHKFFKESKESK